MRLGLVVFSLAFSGTVFADEGFYTVAKGVPAQISKVERSTIAVWRTGGENNSPAATGFLVAIKGSDSKRVGLFVTNYHVVKECLEEHCPWEVYHHYEFQFKSSVATAKDAWKSSFSKVVGFDKDLDLAAFTVNLPKNADVEPVNWKSWKNGDAQNAFAIGNPQIFKRRHPNVKFESDVLQTMWSKGKVNYLITYANKSRRLIHNCDLLPGNSGGPLIDDNGFVLGVNTSIHVEPKENFDFNSEYYATAVPAEEVQSFLSKIKF